MQGHKSERTEKPTTRKLKDARERGQVARSRDMASAVSLIAIILVLGWLGARSLSALTERFIGGFMDVGTRAVPDLGVGVVATLMLSDAWMMIKIVGPVAAAGALLSVVTSVAQTGGVMAPKAMELNWGKLNPAKGFSKFSPIQAGGELAKAVVGLCAVGVLCYLIVRPIIDGAPILSAMSPLESARFAFDRASTLLWQAGLMLAVLAVGDYALQWVRTRKQLKMTKKEVADDMKHQDGSPHTKARVRRVQREMTRKRMMQSVKTATVVITNPTHFAVALQYDRSVMRAPLVVAKGQDEVARRIRALAREHDVPIVENVTLARALYKAADVGDVIPADLFGAVAEILAYLVRLKQIVL